MGKADKDIEDINFIVTQIETHVSRIIESLAIQINNPELPERERLRQNFDLLNQLDKHGQRRLFAITERHLKTIPELKENLDPERFANTLIVEIRNRFTNEKSEIVQR